MPIVTAAQVQDIPEGSGLCVDVDGKAIAIFNVGGNFYAIDDTCTHAEASLAEGELEGTTVTCPWHAASFDITSGEALTPPAFEGVCTYKVHVDGDSVQVEIPED